MKRFILGLLSALFVTVAYAAPDTGPNQQTQLSAGTGQYQSNGVTLYEYNLSSGYSKPVTSSNPLDVNCVSGCSGGGGGGGGSVTVTNFPSSQAVTGSFYPATQPVSATALPLPSGASTAALQPVINADGGSQVHVMNVTATQAISGTVTAVPSDGASLVSGTLSTAGPAALSNFPISTTVGYGSISVDITSIGTFNTIQAQELLSSGNWYQIGQSMTAVGIYAFPNIGTQFRLYVTTTYGGTVTADAILRSTQIPGTDVAVRQVQLVNSAGVGVVASTIYNSALTTGVGLAEYYYPTPSELTTNQATSPITNPFAQLRVDPENITPGNSSFVSFAPSTGVLWSTCGSATKLVRIKYLYISGTATTAGTYNLSVLKTSSAPSGGTATALAYISNTTVGPTSNTATGNAYTAAPTGGTSLGAIGGGQVDFAATGSYAAPVNLLPQGVQVGTQAITLSGVAQCIEISTSTATLTGANMDVAAGNSEE